MEEADAGGTIRVLLADDDGTSWKLSHR